MQVPAGLKSHSPGKRLGQAVQPLAVFARLQVIINVEPLISAFGENPADRSGRTPLCILALCESRGCYRSCVDSGRNRFGER